MKKIILGIVLLIILGLGGGGYWYLKVYQPGQFAKKLIVTYQDFQTSMQNVATNQPDEASFKKESLLVIEKTRTKLNELQPPEQMILFHKDFIAFLDATEHFIRLFRLGPVSPAISDAVKVKDKLGNDLDNKIQELIAAYP